MIELADERTGMVVEIGKVHAIVTIRIICETSWMRPKRQSASLRV